ncbi:MAG: hypothetical protein ACI8PT_004379 [Gammaproteobacteria bacterium]|jgi:hypothetical protein
MSKRYRADRSSATQRWLSGSSFAPPAATLASDLVGCGHTIGTVRSYMCGIAHFVHWCVRVRLSVERVDDRAVGRFGNGHLPVVDVRLVAHGSEPWFTRRLYTRSGRYEQKRPSTTP